ncbi:hypothetical protein QOT17_018730 [Balamuthia mandrillaris]
MSKRGTPLLQLLLCLALLLGNSIYEAWAYNEGVVDELHEPYCEPWSGVPEACAQYVGLQVGTPVFIAGDVTLAWLTSKAIALVNGAGVVDVDPVCEKVAAAMTCRTYFRPCVVDPVTNETIVAPVQPCADMCMEYVSACRAMWESFGVPVGLALFFPDGEGQLPLECNETDPWTNHSLFYQHPTYSFSLPSSGGEMSVNCSGAERYDESFFTGCVEPLVAADKARKTCGFECPLPSLEEGQYDDVKVMQSVIGWLSWVATWFLILTYSLDPKLRQWPSNLIMMVAISANVAAGAIILPSMFGYENVWCGLDGDVLVPTLSVISYDPNTQTATSTINYDELVFKSGLCSFQGGVLLFAFLAGTLWWALIAGNMFAQLYFHDKIPATKRFVLIQQIVFHVVGWGIPLLLAIIPLAAGRIGFSSAATFCFLTNEDDAAFLIAFWFLPISLMIFPSLIFFLCSIGRILYVGVKHNRLQQLFITNYRITVFVGVFLLVYSCIFAYTIQVEANKDTIEQGFQDYYRCLVYDQPEEGCDLGDDVTSYPLVILRALGFSGLGLFLLFTLFTTEWKNTYMHAMKGVQSRVTSYSTSTSSSKNLELTITTTREEEGEDEEEEKEGKDETRTKKRRKD